MFLSLSYVLNNVYLQRVKDIKGVVLKLEEKQDEIELEGKVFEDMRSLKILEIGNVEVSGDFTHLSKQLRLLNWHSYPSQCLPLSFESRYLFQLLLPLSQTRQLWNGQKVSTYKYHIINFFFKKCNPTVFCDRDLRN